MLNHSSTIWLPSNMVVDMASSEAILGLDEICDVLYAECAKSPEKAWTQEDILDLQIVPSDDLNMLTECINLLVGRQLLETLHQGSLIFWKIVNKKDAERLSKLTADEAGIYKQIALSGREGLWVKKIRPVASLHQSLVPATLKKLEGKGYIKSFQSAGHPKQKIYIISELQPSEGSTGGIFYDQGELDQELLENLMKLVEVYVHRRSWHYPPLDSSPNKNGKRKRSREEREEPLDDGILNGIKRWTAVLPKPAGFMGYPTALEISNYINDTGIIKEKIMESETRKVVNLLCWDGRIEKVMNGQAYRTILHPLTKYHGGEEPPKGLGESPCGNCPVFDLCDDSGPVNAQTCTYFDDWL